MTFCARRQFGPLLGSINVVSLTKTDHRPSDEIRITNMKRDMNSALVVCTRRIGDVLLSTPVVRSLKAALPHLMIDMLVFEGTQGIVSANRDIRRIWTIPERPPIGTHLRLLRSIWRRYDVALSVLAGDRPTFHAWMAGRYRVGTLLPDSKSRWKRSLLH